MLSGGVCAVLDYEIDQMTDYVADMAQRIVLPTSPVSPAFRKFVSGLLSATRLPSTTILLSLNYLARRMNMLKAAGPGKVTDGQVWRMLTIGLLLGSKFLDDNTFQNRSWSEVSGIAVSELNTLEQEWLRAMEWKVYVNLDTSKDFQAWLQSWEEYRLEKNAVRAATLDRLAPLSPIDTNVQRSRPYVQTYGGYKKPAPRERPQSGYHYERAPWASTSYPTPQPTPPSAPTSGVTTPEYNNGDLRYHDWSVYNPYVQNFRHQVDAYCQTRIAPYQTPFSVHGNYFGVNTWDSHSAGDCNGPCCYPFAKQPWFMAPAHGHQVVASS